MPDADQHQGLRAWAAGILFSRDRGLQLHKVPRAHAGNLASRKRRMNDIALSPLDRAELCRRLNELHAQQPPADPSTPAMRIGIEEQGELVQVLEVARITEAVKVFEMLGDFGLEPRQGRHHSHDGRRLTRLYASPR